MVLGMEVGVVPGHIVLDEEDQAAPPRKGGAETPPQF